VRAREFFDPLMDEPELTVPEPPGEVVRLQVLVEMARAKPRIWRRLELDGDLRLDVVHRLLQEAMGWEDYHLHAFRSPGGRRHYLTAFDLKEGDEGLAEADVRLDQVLHAVGDRLEYEYDFGDSWDHLLTVEAVLPRPADQPAARCVAGGRACPPEDVGGIYSYNEIAAALRGEPDAEPLDPELVDWLPEDFDPDRFDPDQADAAVRRELEGAGLDQFAAHLTTPLAELVSRLPLYERRFVLGLVAEAVAAAQGKGGEDPVTDAAIAAPWILLLDLLGADGVALTKAGHLPPAVVQPLFEGLGLGQEWIGKGNREDLTPPITDVRHAARDLGLVRVHRGRLVPTKKALAARDHPALLRALVAAGLPLGKHAFYQHAGALCLLLAAAGREDRDPATVATQLLEAAGWRKAGAPLDRWAALDAMRLTRTVLHRTPDPVARRSLARLALGLRER
jgi:hypothetical protein